jgi:uncharacterized protein (DUF2164 family)
MIPMKLPREQKTELIRRVQAYFAEERSETIGELAAEQLLDFMMREIGPFYYNKAVADVRMLLVQKAAQIEDELYAMEQPVLRDRS